MNDAIMTTIM